MLGLKLNHISKRIPGDYGHSRACPIMTLQILSLQLCGTMHKEE